MVADKAQVPWVVRHPAAAGLIALVVVIAGVLGWHEYKAHRSSRTYTATLKADAPIQNLYAPFDKYTVRANTLLTLVCQVGDSERIGAYGALTTGNRYFQLGTDQIDGVPGGSLPTCKDGGLEPHTNSETRFYVQPNPDDGS